VFYFLCFLLGSIAVPLSNGFPGEFQLLMGLFSYNPWLGIFSGLTVILSSVYMLRLFQKSMLGISKTDFRGPEMVLSPSAIFSLCLLASLVFVFGLFPGIISDMTKSALQTLLLAY
jgi:NADH-quinone oxidoreductase subunit M